VSQLSQTTQQNASSSEELAATSEEMSSQAEQLQQTMSFFKLATQADAPRQRPSASRKPASKAIGTTAKGAKAPARKPAPAAGHNGFALHANSAGALDESQFARF
jgi:methyl-accepting chemotaxis protein